MDRKTHVRFSGGCARATAHGYPTHLPLTYANRLPESGRCEGQHRDVAEIQIYCL